LADQAEQIVVTKDEEQPAATIKARSDAEATIARLEAELSIATTERTEAQLARMEAEKIAQQARTDAEIAHKKFEAAIVDVISAKMQFQKLTGSGTPIAGSTSRSAGSRTPRRPRAEAP
jgi:hypothetical protein